MKFKLIIALPVLVFICSFNKKNEIKPAYIIHQMFDSIKNIRTLRVKISALERVDKKFVTSAAELKLQVKPRKLYYHNSHKNVKVLYNSEFSVQKALVKPNSFPYMAVWLDLSNSLMRRNQHYSISELGYDFIGKSIALTIKKDPLGVNNFVYHGRVLKNGYMCYLLQYENKSYSYTSYTVGEKETTHSLAYKLCVNEYLLRNVNDLMNDFGYIKKGTVLKVPSLYCKKAVLYIDEKLMLPVSVSIFDDAGLFESYEYRSIEINKPFLANEFNRDFQDYDF